MKLGVIGGAGLLGSTSAYLAGMKGYLDEIKLVDIKENLAKCHVMDMGQAFAAFSKTKVSYAEYKDLGDCDIILISASIPERKVSDRMEYLRDNMKIVKPICEQIKANCKEGKDLNGGPWGQKDFTRDELDKQWEFAAKMTLIIKDIMLGNPKLDEIGRHEEALGRNAIFGGFQGQRMWTDYKPNGDFTEAILNSTFDWNGKKQPTILATESDNCNGLAMLFSNLLTGRASIFADVRTYWSPKSVERVTGWKAGGKAKDGFMHLLNSGAAALDGTGASRDENGNAVMKEWWKVTDEDIDGMLKATRFSPANRGYFRGGGFSSTYSTKGEMPVTLVRVNLVDGIGYTMQIAEGWTVDLPEEVNKTLLDRTDPTWPSTWFVPRLNETNAFSSVYNVMANWGANHGAFCYGHIGKDLITLASMFRIPVSLHNIEDKDVYRPHAWSAFGTKDLEAADYRACAQYKELYK